MCRKCSWMGYFLVWSWSRHDVRWPAYHVIVGVWILSPRIEHSQRSNPGTSGERESWNLVYKQTVSLDWPLYVSFKLNELCDVAVGRQSAEPWRFGIIVLQFSCNKYMREGADLRSLNVNPTSASSQICFSGLSRPETFLWFVISRPAINWSRKTTDYNMRGTSISIVASVYKRLW